MRWIKKWWWLIAIILAVALVIGWKEKRCQTQSYQCRANYVAQLPFWLTVDQQASAQQTIAAACEPNGYLCRLFSAANLPTILLVFIGFGGIYAAIKTLRAIEGQTEATRRSVELQSAQWVTLKNWQSRLYAPYMLNVEIDILNETNFPLSLQGASFRVGTTAFDETLNIVVVPRASHTVGFVHRFSEEEYVAYLSAENGTTFGVRGAVRFSGISGKKVHPFGGLVTVSSLNGTEFNSRSEYEQSAKEHYEDEPPPN